MRKKLKRKIWKKERKGGEARLVEPKCASKLKKKKCVLCCVSVCVREKQEREKRDRESSTSPFYIILFMLI